MSQSGTAPHTHTERTAERNGVETHEPILSVRDVWIEYRTSAGPVHAVSGASFDLHPGESIALIGESGSGKTTLGLGLLRLLPKSAVIRGEVHYRGRDDQVVDVLRLSAEQVRRFRWQECAMVFQAAQNALNPVARVWDQMLDTVRAHRSDSRDKIRERCERLLGMVQLEPRRVLHAFPHELSRMSVYLSLFFAQFSDALEFVL